MKIDPWDCKYFEADEFLEIDEDGEEWWEWIYLCDCPGKYTCDLNPRGGEQECSIAEKEK